MGNSVGTQHKRIRRPIHLAIKPELLKQAREQGLNLSRVLEDAIEHGSEPPFKEARPTTVHPVPVVKAPVTESKPDVKPVSAYEVWVPSDVKKTARIKTRICETSCGKGPCKVFCDRFRRAYDASK